MPLTDQSITMAAGQDLYTGSLAPAALLTFAMDDAATLGVPAAASIVNSGATASGPWAIPSVAGLSFSPSSGASIAAGETQFIVVTSTTAGSKSALLICAGANISGNPQSMTVTNPAVLALTFSADDTGRVGTAAAGLLQNTGNTSLPWSITPPSGIGVSPSSGTLAVGATRALVITPSAVGTHSLTVAATGATITGNPQVLVAGPALATAIVLSFASTGVTGATVSVTATPNGPIPPGGGTATLAASNSGTLGTTTLTFTAGSSAAQTTTLTRSTDGASVVTMTNSMGLTNTGSGATYTSFTASSSTPFRNARTSTQYATLAQAVAGSISGDTIKVAAGSYTIPAGPGEQLTPGNTYINGGIQLADLTIEWETAGVQPVIDMSALAYLQGNSGGRPIGIYGGTNNRTLTVRGLSLIGDKAGDSYGIYSEAGYPSGNPAATLTIEYCKLKYWADGVKTTYANQGLSVNLRYSTIEDCSGNSLTHGIYVQGNVLDVLGCTFRTTVAGNPSGASSLGHLLKSRMKTTTVRGSLFDMAGGGAACIEAPNGGALTVQGNVILKYNVGDPSNPPIKYGFEETASQITLTGSPSISVGNTITGGTSGATGVVVKVTGNGTTTSYYPTSGGTYFQAGETVSVGGSPQGTVIARTGSPDGTSRDGRTHSVRIDQNTIRNEQPSSWGGTTATAIGALWISPDMTDDDAVPISNATVLAAGHVRNNIVADIGTGNRAVASIAPEPQYADNSPVQASTVSTTGTLGAYSGSVIAGSPVASDAAYAYAGEFTVPSSRTDTNRGGLITGLPSWFSAITVGQWATLSSSTLTTSGVAQSNAGSTVDGYSGGVINTVGIYSGATFIPGTFLCVWGSGHTVGNNELYAFGPFESNAPQWYRPRDETTPNPINAAEDGSGNPVARHTYDALAYVPGINKMLAMGTLFRYTDISGDSNLWSFDFGQVSPNTNQPWSHTRTALPGGNFSPADTCAYESTSGRIWYTNYIGASGGTVSYYDVTADTHTGSQFKTRMFDSYRTTSVVDANRGIWGLFDGTQVAFLRTNSGTSNDFYHPTTTGTVPSALGSPVVWDSYADKFVLWPTTGASLYTLTPPASSPYAGGNAWTWATVTPSGGATPSSASANGTFGRFNLVSFGGSSRGYVLLNSASGPVYFYRAG